MRGHNLFMFLGKIFAAVVLSLCFMSHSQADDIRDFQIEGISIGDSLLKYFSEDEIRKNIGFDYPGSDRFKRFYSYKKGWFEEYDGVQVNFKKTDKNYTVHVVAGQKDFPDNINDCLNLQKKISREVENNFSNAKKFEKKTKKKFDKKGKSFQHAIAYIYNAETPNKEWQIAIVCDDWSKEVTSEHKMQDNLNVSIRSPEFVQFLRYEAFK